MSSITAIIATAIFQFSSKPDLAAAGLRALRLKLVPGKRSETGFPGEGMGPVAAVAVVVVEVTVAGAVMVTGFLGTMAGVLLPRRGGRAG
jgi:hypothetical protein